MVAFRKDRNPQRYSRCLKMEKELPKISIVLFQCFQRSVKLLKGLCMTGLVYILRKILLFPRRNLVFGSFDDDIALFCPATAQAKLQSKLDTNLQSVMKWLENSIQVVTERFQIKINNYRKLNDIKTICECSANS